MNDETSASDARNSERDDEVCVLESPTIVPMDGAQITPEMLPLAELDHLQIDAIVRTVAGGASNVQDIYPLSPLQDGILFHHLLNESNDTYILSVLFELTSSAYAADLIDAVQKVVDRHDILRSAILWENLSRPMQVVYRKAQLPVEMLSLDPHRDAVEQLHELMRDKHQGMDFKRAPLVKVQLVTRANGEPSYALLKIHHVVCDFQSWNLIVAEALSILDGYERELPTTGSYRDYVAWALAHANDKEAEAFFCDRLGEVKEPAAPFGLVDVHGDGTHVEEARQALNPVLARQVRDHAKRLGVSAARVFHAAWGLVVAHTSGRNDVVFGTMLLGARWRNSKTRRMVGLSVNTLPLRLSLANVTAAELIQQTHRELGELLKQEAAPLTLAQRCSGIDGTAPLFTALLNYRRSIPVSKAEEARTTGVRVLARRGVLTNYPIALSVDDLGEGFTLTAQTNQRVDPQRMLGYMEMALQSLVDALEQSSQVPMLALSLLPEKERHQVVEQFNATRVAYPYGKLIHELFSAQAARTPDAIAVVCGNRQLTYGQLNRRANQLAHTLVECGVKPNERVGLHVERSVEMIVGLLGILKAGGAYVPLDVSYPSERLTFVLRDSAPVVLLTQERLKSNLPTGDLRVITVDGESHAPGSSDRSDAAPQVAVGPEHVAYVIYTSGSTGLPKGVMVEHHSVVNLIHWHCAEFSVREGVRCSSVAAIAFDAAVWEIWPPLSSGATLVLAPAELDGDVDALIAWWARQPLDVSFMPTPMAEFIFSRNIQHPQLRVLLIGGDKLRQRPTSTSFRLINNYGPTEATVLATSGCVSANDPVLHIGRPIANAQVFILNEYRRPVPIDVPGEIYIAGAGVARGYLNRADQQVELFVEDSVGSGASGRMYRTGDMGRWRADGTIEFLGRNDEQVKIRGYRIEPGEIENLLARHALVNEAVVIVREDVPGDRRLVAYVTRADGASLSTEMLRTYLKSSLPVYMVPSAFVILECLPLTPNGKLDRRALPVPELEAYASRLYEAPQGEVEEIIAGIWQGLLGVDRVGRHDNFFELGGHSLLVVQLMERLRRVGLSATVRQVFDSPTLLDLSNALAEEAIGDFEVPANRIPPDCTHIVPEMLPLVALEEEHIQRIVSAVPGGAANIQDIYPLAPLQEGILFHHLFDAGGADTYVIPTVLSVCSRARLDDLIAALQGVIDRHDILRTAVLWEQLPTPVQVVYRHATLPVRELAMDPIRDPSEQIKEWMQPDRQRLDLRNAPLMRLQVASDPHSEQWYAMLQLHHTTIDHAALQIVISETVCFMEGHGHQLPEVMSYRNHVAQSLAYARIRDDETFFRSKLGDVDEPTALFGLLDVHGDGTQIEEIYEPMEMALAQRLRAQARKSCVSAATLFHAAWALVVAQTAGRDDVVFGTVLLGRLQGSTGGQRALGMFINTLPMRLRMHGLTAKELVEQTQRELVDLLSHEQASLSMAQSCSAMTGSDTLFNALLNYRHSAPSTAAQWSNARGVNAIAIQERTNYPITLSVDDFGDGFTLKAQTDRRIAPNQVTGYLRTAVQSLVAALEAAPNTPARKLSILPAAERYQVVESFNATRAELPQWKLVHQWFEEQVRRTPRAVAVEHEHQSLTYVELDAKANQLARFLRKQGIGVDQPVGIYMERGLDMVVGLLGILKAGGAYVPLDPSYPSERLQQILTDAAPRIVLTGSTAGALPSVRGVQSIALAEKLEQIAGDVNCTVSIDKSMLTADPLAYVIYTSGSTGLPKGVAMSHGSMVNLIEWQRRHLDAQGQRVLQFAALGFDVAIQEILSTLCTGGTLVVLDEWIRRDVQALMELMNDRSVTRLFVPPLMLQSLAEYSSTTGILCRNLNDVITAGEQLRISPEVKNLFKRLPNCRLHNHYGPTETHVVTALTLTGEPGDWPTLPFIGKPIFNTQIYVLDEQRQPVPLGVAGEIYIAGVGVARGYLDDQKLTTQRFVADPFGDTPSARMYRTGDLGRWQTDGTLEYLGRNDNQVKIRGYRIEPGEIEARLAELDNVKEVAVVTCETEVGERRLVAYLTSRDGGNLGSEEMRSHLAALLPDYMVPSAFVTLESFPLTPSGKLNRRSLPMPDFETNERLQHEPPRGDVEQTLAAIWKETLQVERLSRNDNFFDLGGNSLLVLRALLKTNQAFGTDLRVKDIYKNATIKDVASCVCHGRSQDELVDLAREAVLDDGIVPAPGLSTAQSHAVMLTGGTGFVGRFLLAQLLRHTDATVYCLVRARSKREAFDRINANLVKWALWQPEFAQRIVPVPADLRMPQLGIANDTYEVLCRGADAIYHCATSMNHLETYKMAKAANVDSAKELLRLAVRGRLKLINYVSSSAVFNSAAPGATRVVSEESPIDHERHWNSCGYAASKWVSEKIFMLAGERGIPCNIFRVGLVWADTEKGRFDELQNIYRVFKSCVLSGCGIRNYQFARHATPVDYVARAIEFLGTRFRDGNRIFHVASPNWTIEDVFARCNQLSRLSLNLMSHYDWICEMKRLHHAGHSLPAVPLINYAFSMDEKAFNEHQKKAALNLDFDCTRTWNELEHAGITAPMLSDELLELFVNDMLSRDPELRHANRRDRIATVDVLAPNQLRKVQS